jgi:hypothetical protein
VSNWKQEKNRGRTGRKSEEETEPGRKQRRNRDEKPEEDRGKRTNSGKKTKGSIQ